jgi:hypothetical protein
MSEAIGSAFANIVGAGDPYAAKRHRSRTYILSRPARPAHLVQAATQRFIDQAL